MPEAHTSSLRLPKDVIIDDDTPCTKQVGTLQNTVVDNPHQVALHRKVKAINKECLVDAFAPML